MWGWISHGRVSFCPRLSSLIWCQEHPKSQEGSFREGGVVQICRKLRVKFAQTCWHFVSYIAKQIRKSISDNFMQIPLEVCENRDRSWQERERKEKMGLGQTHTAIHQKTGETPQF